MLKINDSVLVIIDVQGNLADAMHESHALLRNIEGLIKAAGILDIPIIFTEQVPEKLGSTKKSLIDLVNQFSAIKKSTFSCCGADEFNTALKKYNRSHILVAGIETHVCVYQTVRDLQNKNIQTHIVVDAISSRAASNKEVALRRMESLGAIPTTVEMCVTELIGTAAHPQFREILKLIK